MKNQIPMGRKRLLCRNFLRNYTCLFLLISLCASCDKAVFLESSNEKTSSARLGAEALFSTSYEIEEFTAVQIFLNSRTIQNRGHFLK